MFGFGKKEKAAKPAAAPKPAEAPKPAAAPKPAEAQVQQVQQAQGVAAAGVEAPGGLFARFRRGLAKTAEVLNTPVGELFSSPDRAQAYRDLEIALVRADVGADLAARIVADVREREKTAASPLDALRAELLSVLGGATVPERGGAERPRVVFYVGVNGTGKTTTVGKHAAKLKSEGERPLLVACDTFRAAAIEQLATWSERAGVPLVKQSAGADPASVLHDALTRAKERGESPVLVDTAGRLHVKSHLMDEMAKMARVAGRLVEGAPHESWLVIDATTGQNGLAQAREFGKAVPLTGVVLTKLDGTAKGGVAFAIARELKLPIRYVGVGETIEDLVPFDAEAYVEGLLGAGRT